MTTTTLPQFGTTITVAADGLPDEFRSVWTDLRGVSFSQGWIDVNGISTRYLRSGPVDAPKVVMLHGTGGHAEVFAPNLGPFSEHYDCWAIDMVGHGYTDKPDRPYDSMFTSDFLVDFMDAAGIEQADFVSISVGSLHTLRLAQRAPERVRRMVLVTPFGAPMPVPEQKGFYDFWMGKVPARVGERDQASREPSFEVAKKILAGVVADIDVIPDDMIAARFDVARQPGASDAYQHVMWWMNDEARLAQTFKDDELAAVHHPTLAVVGTADAVFVPNGHNLASAMPRCACVEIEGTSHWANYEDPNSFNRFALDFLARDLDD